MTNAEARISSFELLSSLVIRHLGLGLLLIVAPVLRYVGGGGDKRVRCPKPRQALPRLCSFRVDFVLLAASGTQGARWWPFEPHPSNGLRFPHRLPQRELPWTPCSAPPTPGHVTPTWKSLPPASRDERPPPRDWPSWLISSVSDSARTSARFT